MKGLYFRILPILIVLSVLGNAECQVMGSAIKNMMHCGQLPTGVTNEQAMQYASRMAFEWVLINSNVTLIHQLNLKTLPWWCGAGYAPPDNPWWAINADWPKWAAVDSSGNYFQHATPYWLCVRSSDARNAGIVDMDKRIFMNSISNWQTLDGFVSDSANLLTDTKTGNLVMCKSATHAHDCAATIDGKAKWLSAINTLAHQHQKSVMQNIWDGRDWTNLFHTRSDYSTFEGDTFFVETGPLGWNKVFSLCDPDRLVFQAVDRSGVTLKHDPVDYLDCAGAIASHSSWFAYMSNYAEPGDPPVFAKCSAEINLLRTFPNWENLNGMIKRTWKYPANYARVATVVSSDPVLNTRTASKAVDGLIGRNLDDGWTSTKKQASFELRYKSAIPLKYIRLYFAFAGLAPSSYTISGKVAGVWKPLVSAQGSQVTMRLHVLPSTVKVTSVKYAATMPAQGSLGTYLQEIELYAENPSDTMEYISGCSYAGKNLVYSTHPYTGQIFCVFKSTTAVIDLGREVNTIRQASDTWEDIGDGSKDVTITGTAVKLAKPDYIGKGYIITLKSPVLQAMSNNTDVTIYRAGSTQKENVQATADGWTILLKSAVFEVNLQKDSTIKAVKVVFPSQDKRGIDYDIESWNGTTWVQLLKVRANNRDSRMHILETPVTCSQIRYSCKTSAVPDIIYVKKIDLYQ